MFLRYIKNHQSPILRLLGFLRGSWGWVALSVLLGALTVGSNVGLMGTSAFLISAAALHPELGALQIAIVGVRFFGIARGVFRYAERLTSHNVTFRLLARLRTWFYRALEPLAPARLMQYRSGDLLSRIVADVGTLENFYVRAVAPPLVAAVIAAGMTIFFGRYDLTLAWVYLAFTLALGIGVPLLSWTLSRCLGTELISRRAALQSRLVDGIQGLADLLAFGRGADYSESLAADGKAYGQTQRHLASLTGSSSALTTLLVNLGLLAVLALVIPLVAAGQVSGVMLAVLTLSALAGFEAVMPLPLAAQTLLVPVADPLDEFSRPQVHEVDHHVRGPDIDGCAEQRATSLAGPDIEEAGFILPAAHLDVGGHLPVAFAKDGRQPLQHWQLHLERVDSEFRLHGDAQPSRVGGGVLQAGRSELEC